MKQEEVYKNSISRESDGYVEELLVRAIKERDDLIIEVPALKKIQAKIDTGLENIENFEDRLFILAAATRLMAGKR